MPVSIEVQCNIIHWSVQCLYSSQFISSEYEPQTWTSWRLLFHWHCFTILDVDNALCHVHGEFRRHNYLSIRDEIVILLGFTGFWFLELTQFFEEGQLDANDACWVFMSFKLSEWALIDRLCLHMANVQNVQIHGVKFFLKKILRCNI